jgi:hypothetical protein
MLAEYWLMQNNLLRPEESWNAEVVEAINNAPRIRPPASTLS